jgi:dethiobiotin synthetase
MPQLDANIRALRTRLACPLLGVVPFQQDPKARAIAGMLAIDALVGTEA